MDNFIVVISTINDYNKGKEIARKLVEDKLAACVNIIPKVSSVYSWQGEICEDDECLMVMKTKGDLFEPLKDNLIKLHPYKVPEIISFRIKDGNKSYLEWINNSVID